MLPSAHQIITPWLWWAWYSWWPPRPTNLIYHPYIPFFNPSLDGWCPMNFRSILTYSFAIFAMFFGSGNLVFPLQIGLVSGSAWLSGFLGLLLTGILLPFLGLFVIKLNQGDISRFFGQAGYVAKIILPLFVLSLLGSFGVIPRCITVAHGGLNHIAPGISLFLFSAFFSMATYFLCLRESTMIRAIGSFMSPLLLLFLSIFLLTAIFQTPLASLHIDASGAFKEGFITGYQTMDLFAAFFFSALIFKQIQQSVDAATSERALLKIVIIPSILSSLLLAFIYVGFVYLGAHYEKLIVDLKPELMLPTIVTASMGPYGALLIAMLIGLSCLTTAVALNNIYARYLCTTLAINENKFPFVLIATTLISFLISLLDFKGIAQILAPALDISYPGLIILTILCIVFPKRRRLHFYGFWGVTIISALNFLLN